MKRVVKSHLLYRGVEQWLARWAHNPKVVGSNPAPAIFFRPILMADHFVAA